jgi:hypothetical protein
MYSNPPCIPPNAPQDVALPYEYDEYYNTRVARPWSRLYMPFCLGVTLILLGLFSLIFSCVDFARSAVMNPFTSNPNYLTVGIPASEDASLAATWQENSMWPTLGKGFWVGLLVSFENKLQNSTIYSHKKEQS